MQELVGYCISCNKQVFCQDGFINGVVMEDKRLMCFACSVNGTEDESKMGKRESKSLEDKRK